MRLADLRSAGAWGIVGGGLPRDLTSTASPCDRLILREQVVWDASGGEAEVSILQFIANTGLDVIRCQLHEESSMMKQLEVGSGSSLTVEEGFDLDIVGDATVGGHLQSMGRLRIRGKLRVKEEHESHIEADPYEDADGDGFGMPDEASSVPGDDGQSADGGGGRMPRNGTGSGTPDGSTGDLPGGSDRRLQFTGRIKRVRIRKRRTGGFRLSGKGTIDVGSGLDGNTAEVALDSLVSIGGRVDGSTNALGTIGPSDGAGRAVNVIIRSPVDSPTEVSDTVGTIRTLREMRRKRQSRSCRDAEAALRLVQMDDDAASALQSRFRCGDYSESPVASDVALAALVRASARETRCRSNAACDVL